MSPMEIAFLALVIAAFTVFGVTLAVVSSYERAGARAAARRDSATPRTEDRKYDKAA